MRPARAIPYTLHARGAVQPENGSFWIEMRNAGQACAVFQVRSGNAAHPPRSYTVEPHKQLIDTWRIAAIGASEYDVSVYGPNGFFRGFKGTISGNQRAYLAVHADYDEDSNAVRLEITNRGLRTARISVVNAYRSRSMTSMLGAGDTDSKSWSLSAAGGWYDLVITVDGDPHLEYRLAGHLEDGEDSISDPAMGGVV